MEKGMGTAEAVDILTPGKKRYTPEGYERALEKARVALEELDRMRWRRFDRSMPCVDEDVLCTDGVYLWTDSVVQGKATGDGQVEYYLDSGNDISASRIWWMPKLKLPMTCENCKRFFAGAENAVGVCGKSGELVWRHAATCDELLER